MGPVEAVCLNSIGPTMGENFWGGVLGGLGFVLVCVVAAVCIRLIWFDE